MQKRKIHPLFWLWEIKEYYYKKGSTNTMNKKILLSVLLSVSLSAEYVHYFNGQKEYLKQCWPCHQNSKVFVPLYTVSQWQGFMEDNGTKLANIHIDSRDPEARELQTYFESSRYLKKTEPLSVFLEHFAKDSDHNRSNTDH